MVKIVTIEKSGSAKSVDFKNNETSIDYLCKKCGFKSLNDFKLVHAWTTEFNNINYVLNVYGKTKGKSGSENKYEFPPPIDNTLLFGNCVAVLCNETGEVINMDTHEFADIMEYLYGGFEDIESESSESEEDESEDVGTTKEGYSKDGFVVSDDEEEEHSKKTKTSLPPKKPTVVKKKPAKPEPVVVDNVLTISDELGEDSYL